MIDEAPFGIIYLTSRVSGGQVVRRYIGQHRLKGGRLDDSYLGSGKALTAAIRKHGRSSFVREVLELCRDGKHLDEAEKFWIEFYDAVADPGFYNLAEGGRGKNAKNRKPVYQFDLSGKFLRKFDSVSHAALEAGCSEAQMTTTCKSARRTARGYIWRFSPSTPQAVQEGVAREVEKLDHKGNVIARYASVTEAAKSVGVKTTANLSACCSGRRRSFAGFRWRYAGHPTPEIKSRPSDDREFVAMDERGDVHVFRGLPHIRETFGQRAVGNVLACAKGRRAKAVGFTWRIA